MSNNNYFVDGKIKLPYNFEKEKYIIGVEKKSDNTLVGTKTIVPIKDTPPNNKIEITPVFSPTFHFAYENNVFNIIKNELYFNINLIIDEIPVSLKELNDEKGLVVDWDEKYLIEKTNNPAEFKLSLKEGYTSISDTKSVLYNELINNRVFSESINVYIKHDDLYFNTKLDILFSKSYFEVTSLYDTIDINSGVSENFITIDGYYNDTKVNKDDLSLKLKKNGENIFTNVISTLGFVSLTKVKNEWALHCEDSDKTPSATTYQVSTGGEIVFNGQKVQYVYNDNGEYFDLNSGKRVFLEEKNSDGSTVVYDNKNVIPGINIIDPFNNIKINKIASFDSINNTFKDTHDRVKISNDGEYYPIDKVHAITVLNANKNFLYDKNGRLVNENVNDTLIIEGGLTKNGSTIYSGGTHVIVGNGIVNNLNGLVTKTNGAFYYRGKLLYSGTTGYFNGEPVSNLCPLVTDEQGNVLYCVKQSNTNIYITDGNGGNSLYIGFDKNNKQWTIYGGSVVFSVNKNGELLYNGVVIGDTNGNLYRRHDLNLIDFKHTNLVIDEAKITDIYDGSDVESEIVNRDEVYYDAHSISEIKKSIPNLFEYLQSYNNNKENTELPKINIEATYDGAMVDEKVFSISNGTLNHSSYGIKIEPQVITQSMIQNGGTVTAYIVNKSGEQIPHSTYSKNNYSFSYVFDNNNNTNTVTSDTCTINLSTDKPVYNEIKFTLKCGDRTVKEEIVEVLGENRLITSVKYIDVTTGATYTITPNKDLYGNKIDWYSGNTNLTTLTISPGDTTQKILNGYVNHVKIYEQTVIPVKNGNDGESPYTLVLTNTNASISCDSNGNILNGAKMPTCQAILYKGTEVVENGVKFTINSIANVNINETGGTINFNPGFTFTGDSLEIVVSATTNNTLRGKAIMTITKAKQGEKGGTGRGISSVTEYYLVTSTTTGITTATSGWTTGVTSTDSVKKYLWNYEETTYTDGTTEETKPVIIGTHGDDGRGISSVTEYYLATSASTNVSTSTSGWTTGITTTTTTNKYLWNYEETTYTDGTTGETKPVIIGTHGANGTPAVSYWMEVTPNVLKKEATTTSYTINIIKWQQTGSTSPTNTTNGFLLFYDGNKQIGKLNPGVKSFSIPTSSITGNTLDIKWVDGSSNVYDTQTIPILKDGDRGKLLYPAGRWNSGTTYDGTDSGKTPFVLYESNGKDEYYVLTATTKVTNAIPGSSTAWTKMAQYEALYTKLLVADNGLIGGSVYNGDYVFSKDGVLSGNNTSNYSGFTSQIVDNVFSGNTPTDKFVPNYLVDFNKGRAWFGNGNTLINEKGGIITNELTEVIEGKCIGFPSGNTIDESNSTLTGVIKWDHISSSAKYKKEYYDTYFEELKTETGYTNLYFTNIDKLNTLIYDHEKINNCLMDGRVILKLMINDPSIKRTDIFYKGTIFSPPHCQKYLDLSLYNDTSKWWSYFNHYDAFFSLSVNSIPNATTCRNIKDTPYLNFLFKWNGETSTMKYGSGNEISYLTGDLIILNALSSDYIDIKIPHSVTRPTITI